MKIEKKYISETVRKGVGLLAEIHKRKHEAYIAGGAVRDLVIRQLGMVPGTDAEVPVHDVDIATNMPIEDLKLAFRCDSNNGEAHGTILVHYDGMVFEVTQFRIDGNYSDGRHPDSVKFANTFKEDCSRRDFTINAMGLDKDLNVIDYFDGISDLVFRRLRTVGNPYCRFNEDHLRVIRGMRFAARFGLMIEEQTKLAMHKYMHAVDSVAMERIHDEMYKCAGYGITEFTDMMKYMGEFGFCDLFPDANMCIDRQCSMVACLLYVNPSADYIMGAFFAMLSPDVMRTFRCSKVEIKIATKIRTALIDILTGKFGDLDNPESLLYSVDLVASPEFWTIRYIYRDLHPFCGHMEDDVISDCQHIVKYRLPVAEYGKRVTDEGIPEGPEFGKRLKEIMVAEYQKMRQDYHRMEFSTMRRW